MIGENRNSMRSEYKRTHPFTLDASIKARIAHSKTRHEQFASYIRCMLAENTPDKDLEANHYQRIIDEQIAR